MSNSPAPAVSCPVSDRQPGYLLGKVKALAASRTNTSSASVGHNRILRVWMDRCGIEIPVKNIFFGPPLGRAALFSRLTACEQALEALRTNTAENQLNVPGSAGAGNKGVGNKGGGKTGKGCKRKEIAQLDAEATQLAAVVKCLKQRRQQEYIATMKVSSWIPEYIEQCQREYIATMPA
jgi:hypothetical protein